MNDTAKKAIHESAQARVAKVTELVRTAWAESASRVEAIRAKMRRISNIERFLENKVLLNAEQRQEELAQLASSPYFVCCEVEFAGRPAEALHFAKFNFSDERIYSWTAPVATLRFNEPGEVSYLLPDGSQRSGVLSKKDQFMIVDGKIVFMASEALGQPRQLVYQEHLTRRQDAFVLPEIVAQMEKEQDRVVRADHRGSYLISGPAGSGKTTLALHRAAYLALSPDTAEQFPGDSIIIFVNDNATRSYFSQILPQLGINNARITVFGEWAREILGLAGYGEVYRWGASEAEKDELEYRKSLALENFKGFAGAPPALPRIYQPFFSDERLADAFRRQLEAKLLDRFDLTLLLKCYLAREGALKKITTFVVEDKRGRETIKRMPAPIKYSLIVIDEAENYLAEQIALIKSCADRKQAVLYVGDLAQQTKLRTIRDWHSVGEEFEAERKVELGKVYRNTKAILEYIRSQGFDVAIPDGMRPGDPVHVQEAGSPEEEAVCIRRLVEDKPDAIIGILHHESSGLARYREEYKDKKNVFPLTIDEAQGVEFEVVIYFDIGEKTDGVALSPEFAAEKKRVQRDLKYVALTRAMNELHVIKSL